MVNSTIAPERFFSCISRSFNLEMYSTDMESDRPPLRFRIKMEHSEEGVTHFTQNCCKYKILRQLLVPEVEKTILRKYLHKFKCIPGQFIFLGKTSSLFPLSVLLPFLCVLPLHLHNCPLDLQQCHTVLMCFLFHPLCRWNIGSGVSHIGNLWFFVCWAWRFLSSCCLVVVVQAILWAVQFFNRHAAVHLW